MDIDKTPRLTRQDEIRLVAIYRQTGCTRARDKIIMSLGGLAGYWANKYCYGDTTMFEDLRSEGLLGAVKALEKFDPLAGVRFSSYAVHFVKSHITYYVFKNWSMVKLSSSVDKKKLYNHLSRVRAKIVEGDVLHGEDIVKIAEALGVSEADVMEMTGRLAGKDASLNKPMGGIEGDGEGAQMQDTLVDPNVNTEDDYAEEQEKSHQIDIMAQAIVDVLTEKEKDIFVSRRVDDPPVSAKVLVERYGITRQRVSQVEEIAFQKVKKRAREIAATLPE